MAEDTLYARVFENVDRDEVILQKAKEIDAQFEEPRVEIDQWTTYVIKLFQSSPTDRVVVFRPRPSQNLLGCIRVYKPGTTTKLWDVFEANGTFIGKIPKGCIFEAMLVDLRLLTLNSGS